MTNAVAKAFFFRVASLPVPLSESCLAELLAEVDELRRQGAETLVLGDLCPCALDGGLRNQTGHGFPLDLEGQRPVGTVTGRAIDLAAATRLAALKKAASQRAGTQLTDGDELLLAPVPSEGESSKGVRCGHGGLLSCSL